MISSSMNTKEVIHQLNACKEWVLAGDASELWPARVEAIFEKLTKDLSLVK